MTFTNSDFSDDYENFEAELNWQDRRYRRRQGRPTRVRTHTTETISQLTDFSDNAIDFVPSYAAALDPLHFERQWIINSLGTFYQDNLITDVTRMVKGGKEANVYCCPANPALGLDLIAAKLYRPRMLRHLRNDAMYKEGRLLIDDSGDAIRGGREIRALQKKTRFGKHLGFMNWIGYEYQVQTQLYEAGADVPKPIAQRANTILMAYIGDEWLPAPTLNEVSLEPDEAQPLFDRIMDNVRLMLSHHYVHGDLSAYNILYWQGEITIIDFPQLVDARKNRNALMLLERDVRRVAEYFARFGLAADPLKLTMDIWELYMEGDF